MDCPTVQPGTLNFSQSTCLHNSLLLTWTKASHTNSMFSAGFSCNSLKAFNDPYTHDRVIFKEDNSFWWLERNKLKLFPDKDGFNIPKLVQDLEYTREDLQ